MRGVHCLSLALFLWFWQRVWSGRYGVARSCLPVLAGICRGFVAALQVQRHSWALVIIAAWSGLDPARSRRLSLTRKLAIAAGAIATIIVALAVFVGSNPFMTARPRRASARRGSQELAGMNLGSAFDSRSITVSSCREDQKSHLPERRPSHVARQSRRSSPSRDSAVSARSGPLKSDSTVRFDLRQDWGAIALGAAGLVRAGRVDPARSELSTEPASRRPHWRS